MKAQIKENMETFDIHRDLYQSEEHECMCTHSKYGTMLLECCIWFCLP